MGMKAALEGRRFPDAVWKVEMQWWGWEEVMAEEASLKLGSSTPCKESWMPSERRAIKEPAVLHGES